MSIDLDALKRLLDVAKSLDIDDLEERLDWADRDPSVEEAALFTDREVAYFLRVSPRTVSRFVDRGFFIRSTSQAVGGPDGHLTDRGNSFGARSQR